MMSALVILATLVKSPMKRTPAYRGAKAWNSPPLDIRDTYNKLPFKMRVKGILSQKLTNNGFVLLFFKYNVFIMYF